MFSAYPQLKKLIPALNERELIPRDFYDAAKSQSVDVCEMKLKKRGYHIWDDGDDFVFIKKGLSGLKWLETALHELFHALLQVPAKFLHRSQQMEVTALALIALIPIARLFDNSFLEENPTRHAHFLFRERQRVFFLYGV